MTEDQTNKAEHLAAEDWSGEMGRRWLANVQRFEAMIAPVGEALLAQAAYRPGERVIDLGCGGGATTLAIARAVANDGVALGLDISPDLINHARERADAAGLANARFVCADAATATLTDAPFGRLFSRFGSMFFAEPHQAFANLRAQLVPGGRVDLAVWGPPRDNAWMMAMMGVARRHIDIPPAVPRTPGPFAFEDVDYLGEVLTGGGFAGIEITPWEGLQAIGGKGLSVAEAADFALASLAIGRALEQAGTDVHAAARADLEELFARHHSPEGGVQLGAKVWLVSARA
ncbi:methyltransferase domain-containing protein [Sphingomonas lacunae]|uniref:Methyltransferase domain-containing protein n=1 Tax=Sphingomonas lacunae TaxID=2698828 RepID=A0A6M4AQ64_9SPHN|nr:class I SAM-dependent methyltransferase [Sphingomonas lacunae]QJQ31168.1 methyltransferase domain-containing protein [Sphingomonas lacunae]